jgi:hypothetical protein
MPEHLGPDDGTRWLTPADELEEIELGDRVIFWSASQELGSLYTSQRDRIMSATLQLVGSVASATSHRGLPYPPEWWPPSVGTERLTA